MNSKFMAWEDIDRATAAWRAAGDGRGAAFDEFRGKFLPLPDWYERNLEPKSKEYRAQQDRLWSEMAGAIGEYDAEVHELTGDAHFDPIVRPGFYAALPARAGEHLIALGHIVKHSGVVQNSRVIEYGAGFGQIAVTFARLGAEVHTVDVDDVFCNSVNKQASFFNVRLQAHKQVFGYNPGGLFDLIIFYESFHHCRDFLEVIPKLKAMLKPTGKIILAGEPTYGRLAPWSDGYSYPWGIRLFSDVAVIVRIRKWYELGFQQDFLVQIFEDHGFKYLHRPGHISTYASLHEFTLSDPKA